MKAIIFAAGLGSRLKEETLHKPKALVEIGGKTLLQFAIEKLTGEGITEIVVNVHHFSSLITDFISTRNFGVPVKISDETDKLLDTGGALKKAIPLLGFIEPVLIYNVDVFSSLQLSGLFEDHMKSGALATLVVRNRETQRYFKFNHEKRLVGWINKKTGEEKVCFPGQFDNAAEMAFSGIHIVSPEIFKLLPEENCFSITSLYMELAGNHLIKGFFDDSELWLDVGKPESLQEARKMFSNRANQPG